MSAAKRLIDHSQATPCYGQQLLAAYGLPPLAVDAAAEHPAKRWASSGLWAITGRVPRICPLPIATVADQTLAAFVSLLSPTSARPLPRGGDFLSERAGYLQWPQLMAGVALGGSARLYRTNDRHLCVNLARLDDWELVPAWLECPPIAPNDFTTLAQHLQGRGHADLLLRGRELGLALAAEPAHFAAIQRTPLPPWCRPNISGPLAAARSRLGRPLRVLELASLWAGPLAGRLLHAAGADVVKLESRDRPDGARAGNTNFFDVLNGGKSSLALDLRSNEGRAQCLRLIAAADVVIEGSRPRALAQLGIDSQILVRQNPGLTWIGITAYGRGPETDQWLGYGDDVAIAAGFSTVMQAACGQKMFVGDALADPLTGLHAAFFALYGSQCGGGYFDVSLFNVAQQVLQFALPHSQSALKQRYREWRAHLRHTPACLPQPPTITRRAANLGQDTEAVLHRWLSNHAD